MTFRERLKGLRGQRGWDQTQLAFYAGKSQGVIGAWEAGLRGITLTNLRTLAAAFGLTLSELLEGVE